MRCSSADRSVPVVDRAAVEPHVLPAVVHGHSQARREPQLEQVIVVLVLHDPRPLPGPAGRGIDREDLDIARPVPDVNAVPRNVSLGLTLLFLVPA